MIPTSGSSGFIFVLLYAYLFYNFVVVVQSLSCIQLFVTHGLQHTKLPCLSLSPGVWSNSCLLSRWCHPTTLSSVALFSCHQSFPESKSFPRIGSLYQMDKVLELHFQHQPFQWISRVDFLRTDCFNLLLSKGLLRVFSNTTVRKYQFLGSQPS